MPRRLEEAMRRYFDREAAGARPAATAAPAGKPASRGRHKESPGQKDGPRDESPVADHGRSLSPLPGAGTF